MSMSPTDAYPFAGTCFSHKTVQTCPNSLQTTSKNDGRVEDAKIEMLQMIRLLHTQLGQQVGEVRGIYSREVACTCIDHKKA